MKQDKGDKDKDSESLFAWVDPRITPYLQPATINVMSLACNPHDCAVDWLLQHPEQLKGISSVYSNPNDRMVDWILSQSMKDLQSSAMALSINTNDRVVSFLLQQPLVRDDAMFSLNDNEQAVAFLLNHLPNGYYTQMCGNKHNRIVSLYMDILSETIGVYHISAYSSWNTNDQMVLWLIQHPIYIDWQRFSANDNDHAVDYLIQHPESIAWNQFCCNPNKRAFAFLLQHPGHINVGLVWANPNLFAHLSADYVLK